MASAVAKYSMPKLATAIAAAKKLGANKGELMKYETSYDKSPGESFVGYAGILF